MTVPARLRRVAATLLLSFWWGGFSFYAGRVVFIGHAVLHSKIRQGFITERVTTELNWLALATLAFAGWEFFASRAAYRRTTWVIWSVALVTTLVLFPLHTKLAGMLDFDTQVAADEHFYGWHRVYLLVATVQWLFGAALIILVQPSDGTTIKNPPAPAA